MSDTTTEDTVTAEDVTEGTDAPEDATTTEDSTDAPRKRGRILSVGPVSTTAETAQGKVIVGDDKWVRQQIGLEDTEAKRQADEKARREAEVQARRAEGAEALPDAQAKAEAADQARADAHDALAEAVAENPVTAAYLAYLDAERRASAARSAMSSARDLANLGHDRHLGHYTPRYPSLTDALDALATDRP